MINSLLVTVLIHFRPPLRSHHSTTRYPRHHDRLRLSISPTQANPDRCKRLTLLVTTCMPINKTPIMRAAPTLHPDPDQYHPSIPTTSTTFTHHPDPNQYQHLIPLELTTLTDSRTIMHPMGIHHPTINLILHGKSTHRADPAIIRLLRRHPHGIRHHQLNPQRPLSPRALIFAFQAVVTILNAIAHQAHMNPEIVAAVVPSNPARIPTPAMARLRAM